MNTTTLSNSNISVDKTGETSYAVIGGGLVGALQACVLASQGHKVDLYEYRRDIRSEEMVENGSRSINLALSVRGLTGLSLLDGLQESIKGIPLSARLIHNLDGSTFSIPYDTSGQGRCIYSIERKVLNKILLKTGERFSKNLKFHFCHKLMSVDHGGGDGSAAETSKLKLTFKRTNVKNNSNINNNGDSDTIVKETDVVFGCDGSYSTVRRELMKRVCVDYSQTYIPHSYLELTMPPATHDGRCEFAMPPNYLHIWPRGEFMMIALPNQDKTFTLTLFMPNNTFQSIDSRANLISFFEANFPDSISLIGGEEALVRQYFGDKPAPLISIKCSLYHWQDKMLIMGDAAHAMVPFYGQGMNCGLEDVFILNDLMQKNDGNRLEAFKEFSKFRSVDAQAMCDLAMYNYIEMRDLVRSKSFNFRKTLDRILQKICPNYWIPLYTSVTFTRMRYHMAVNNKEWQDRFLTMSFRTTLTLMFFHGAVHLFPRQFEHCLNFITSVFMRRT